MKDSTRSIFWIGFNLLLLLGGIASLFLDVSPIILVGILVFCPYSIAKNTWKFFKFRKAESVQEGWR